MDISAALNASFQDDVVTLDNILKSTNFTSDDFYGLISFAMEQGASKTTRLLLDVCIEKGINLEAKNDKKEFEIICVPRWFPDVASMHLIDAGVTLNIFRPKPPEWMYNFVDVRNQLRLRSLAILTLKKRQSKILGQNGPNVLAIIARCLWSQRGNSRFIKLY